jgi:CHAD domain-containing protein
VRRVDAAAKTAADAAGERHSSALHEVRKAAKRARYAAESAQPPIWKPATRLAARMEAVLEVLGEVQDSTTARGLLRELGGAAHGAGENGFTFGLMHREEVARAAAAQAEADTAIRKAGAPAARRWLT